VTPAGVASAHHRPGHTGGPQPPSPTPAAVAALPADAAASMPAGGYSVTIEF
jgi:hypothetical protein